MANRYGGGYRNGGAAGDDYDPYGENYSTSTMPARPGTAGSGVSDRYRQPPPSRGRYDELSPNSTRTPPPPRGGPRPPPPPANPTPPPGRPGPTGSAAIPAAETDAERQISRVLEHIRLEWPTMLQNDCVPVQLALQLLDNSSVGRAHDYRKFQETHMFLQNSLKNIVHEHHQGFNSSIGTFHKIQGSIQVSQKRVRALKDSLASARTCLCTTDPELKKLSSTSQAYDELLQTLNEVEELRTVPDQLEARISEKKFLTAVELLQNALRKMRRPELDEIGALADLRSYLSNQETALTDILAEELHEHLYLKSPYCQERWQSLAKNQGTHCAETVELVPFHGILDSIDFDRAVTEDPAKNPESDTFYYVGLLVEALNKLGRLQNAVDTLKQRMPVELFGIVNETINEVDNRHLSSLRGGSSTKESEAGVHVYNSRETQLRADVIYDLLWTLYGKFEAIGEGHRVFHESVKALIRRDGSGNNSALLGSFKELWVLYQSEIRSLLHNYVTTDADVYRFDTTNVGSSIVGGGGGGGGGGKKDVRDNLFKLSEADVRSPEMMDELDALEGIIQAAVPGLTDSSRKSRGGGGGGGGGGAKKAGAVDGGRPGDNGSFRKNTFELSADGNGQTPGTYKSLVEPSVFNMSLLLPPTLAFLQRLKGIVPPGSDLATSTLTTFLDNFLVNVFQPQLDESLSKLGDAIFVEPDSFSSDQDWKLVAKRPVLKGTTAFFGVATAFCRMLGTIPHDQALSSLIVRQMNRYYERCLNWYKSLVSKTQEEDASAAQALRVSARMALEPGEMHDTMKMLWDAPHAPDPILLAREVRALIAHTDESRLSMSDVIQDRDIISSLCLLYTSMNWLAVKISGLRHITVQDTDSSRANLPKQSGKRWTLMNDPAKATADQGPVFLPMTHATVKTFDTIVSSYEDLAVTALLTLHMEVRCQVVYSLAVALDPETAPYLLDQEVAEPDPQILTLNSDLVAYDETLVRYLRDRETTFIRSGLGLLVNSYLVTNASHASPMNARGCRRMRLNVLVLQQNLKNIEEGVDLARAFAYYDLFERGPDAIVEKARENAAASTAETDEGAGGEKPDAATDDGPDRFTYDELKALMELCFSEQLANPERGIAAAAKRQLADKMLGLSEHMWQS